MAEVERHHRPVSPAAPHPSEEQQANDLGNCVMDNAYLDHTCQQAKECAFELRVLLTYRDGNAQEKETNEE